MSSTGLIDSPIESQPIVTQPTVMHDGVSVVHGTRKDGVAGATLAGFLTHHQRTDSPFRSERLWRWGSTPPVVRVASGTTAIYVQEVRRAVEIINGALPRDYQMTFDPTPRQEDQPFGHGTVWYDGEIVVNFADSGPGGHGGFTRDRYGREEAFGDADIVNASRVSIASDNAGSSQHRLALLVHEIGHSLGIGGDTWANIYRLYPDSIMTYVPGEPLQPNGSDVIYPLDRDSFLALYGVLEPGMTADEITAALSDWTDTTMTIRGELTISGSDVVAFGASGRNGFMDAWATGGTTPATDLAANDALSGTVSWAGRLLGIDAESNTIAGVAGLSVDLATLAGSMDFTDLESWTVGQAPGAIGTGTEWGDGDLAYRISVRGNTFARTGGDDGNLVGRFYGNRHEGIAGTVERADLTAAFGAAMEN